MGFGNGYGLSELTAGGEQTEDELRARFGEACLLVDATELRVEEGWIATASSIVLKTPRGSELVALQASSLFPLVKKPTSTADFVSVGRGDDSDVWLPHASVSRFHAYLHVKDGAVIVRDARSENGTFVDDVRVPPTGPHAAVSVTRGQNIRFGDVTALLLGPSDLRDLLASR